MASIKRDSKTGEWYCRVSYKIGDQYKTKMKKNFKTKKEAQLYAASLEELYDNDGDTPANEIIFANYFEEWCDTYKIGRVAASTEDNYLLNIKIVHNYFGKLKLQKLTRKKYQEFINWRGQNRSKNTVEKTHHKIKRCIENALADGLIKKDPTYNVILTYDVEESGRIKYWNASEAMQLLKVFTTDLVPKNVILYICLTTGLRISEVLGLSWDDITKNKLSVKRAYDYNYTNDFTKGKTQASIRTIAVTDEFNSIINMYKIKYIKTSPTNLFLDKRKHPIISHNSILAYLKRISKKLGIEPLGIHSLRHTHCSMLIAEGLNIAYISKRLGHEKITETLNTYSHVIDELDQSQNEKALDILNRIGGQ